MGRNTVKYGVKGTSHVSDPFMTCVSQRNNKRDQLLDTGAIIGGIVTSPLGVVGGIGHGVKAIADKCGAKKGSLKINKNSAPRPEWTKSAWCPNPKKWMNKMFG